MELDTAALHQTIKKFFRNYEAAFNRALAGVDSSEETVQAFAGYFVAANPNGVACGSNNDEFRTAIGQGCAFYRNIGTKTARIVDLNITLLDDYHAMVKVFWDWQYVKEGREDTLAFSVIYFVQLIEEQPKIFAFITGDEQKLLQEKGLV
jgi:hypothetical protein